MYEIIFYSDKEGNEPAREFLDSLDHKMRAKMVSTISLAAEYGPQLREPYSKTLDNGICELRAKVGSNITRTLYFFFTGKKIILTNGFVKKTDKTPTHEIDKAKKYRADYLERQGEQ